jgi:hypothetical protein
VHLYAISLKYVAIVFLMKKLSKIQAGLVSKTLLLKPSDAPWLLIHLQKLPKAE